MSRLIDADALLEEHCDGCSLQQREMCKGDPVCGSAMWIVEAPTVDAVEVVRCKDCKYYATKKNATYNGHFCDKIIEFVEPNGFCCFAERRTE